ncbi:MAG: class I SAM-dependent RNA methyltransferase [Desulfobacterota bacterium]|nr:class I SAM-dependent RNA methyltransferase [Thermodesulfobacteriota bacterium]
MRPWEKKSRIVITCAKGIVPFLKEELRLLEFPILAEGTASVETEGTMEDAMRLNLFIRTGHRVLFFLERFTAKDPEELYQKVSKMGWEEVVPETGYLCVTSTVDHPTIRDTRFANVKCKDAIVDRIREVRGKRPDSGSERNRTVVHLFWKADAASLYIDTSGEPLSKRGYRKIPLKAPMQETLAAGVVLATGWRGESHFVNPMCGSGTLAIEAALIGLGRPPGLLRSNYGFMHLKGFEESSWREIRRKARATARDWMEGKIIATDISAEAVQGAQKNAQTAGVDRWIEFGICPYEATPIPQGEGVVVVNPEYGERMGEKETLKEIYKGLGDFFKKRCQGYRGYIFTGNLELAKRVGLRPKRKVLFYNSNIECRLLEYELYEGSQKAKTADGRGSNLPSTAVEMDRP